MHNSELLNQNLGFLFTVLITYKFSKRIGYFSIFSLLTGFPNPLLIL